VLFSAVPAFSQLVSFGFKGGVPLADPLISSSGGSGGTSHGVHRYVVGVTGELHLPFGFSFEVDALYRRLDYDTTFVTFVTTPSEFFETTSTQVTQTHTTGNDWQFPFLAKYHFKQFALARPFVDGGVTFRHVNFSGATIISNPNTAGVTVGGGVGFKLLLLRIAPEIRYTRFPTNIFGPNYNFIRSSPNQVDFLVGLTF
jgi:hypothetical protein